MDLLSAAPSITGQFSMSRGQHLGYYEAKQSGSPMHTRFPALPPSPPSPWEVLGFLATFKNAFWHSAVIRH